MDPEKVRAETVSTEETFRGDTARGAKRRERTMKRDQSSGETLLTPAEVAALFRVDPKTVTRWAKAGKLSSIRTLGGHRRYRESEVMDLLEGVAPRGRTTN
jgi:excisionase family DNA binding protein